MANRILSQKHKYGPGTFDLERKIFSWSAYNVWQSYGPAEFTKKYVYGGADYMNPRMMTGRIVADMLESDKEQDDPTLEHLRTFLPRYEYQEYEIEVPFAGLTLVMHLDGFNEPKICECQPGKATLGCPAHTSQEPYGKIGEYKTGVKWNEKMVAKHEQLDWYALGVHLKFGVDPEKVPIVLTWMPTIWGMNDEMPRPTGEIVNFDTTRTLLDCIKIGKKITNAWKDIEKYVVKERKSIGL